MLLWEIGGMAVMSKLFPITPKFWILIVYNLYEGNDHIFSDGIMKFEYEPTLGHPNGEAFRRNKPSIITPSNHPKMPPQTIQDRPSNHP